MLRWTVHLKGGPRKKSNAAVAVGYRVYVFGGLSVGEIDQIDVHVFNTVSLNWIALPSVTNGRGEPHLNVPSQRLGHTAALIEDVIYILGGFTGSYCRMLYAFDVDTHTWFKPTISGNVPGASEGHSACVSGKDMYIYGGFNLMTGYINDIHKLDTTTMVWSLINTRANEEPGSFCHSATIIRKKMFVFGGRSQSELDYNYFSVFDTDTNCWLSTTSAQPFPERRACHSAFAYNGELYIFGGHNCSLNRTFNDLWKFNPESFAWENVEPKGRVPCSWMSRMSCCIVGSRIILFGGYRYTTIPQDIELEDTNEPDLYILDLSPTLKTLCKLAVIQYGLEQSGLPQSIRWEMAAMTKKVHYSPNHVSGTM